MGAHSASVRTHQIPGRSIWSSMTVYNKLNRAPCQAEQDSCGGSRPTCQALAKALGPGGSCHSGDPGETRQSQEQVT